MRSTKGVAIIPFVKDERPHERVAQNGAEGGGNAHEAHHVDGYGGFGDGGDDGG
jgi:hypothetical protein